jgi:uncharacterized protein with PIN domain
MATATFRLYEELNDYLPRASRKRDLRVSFEPPCPVRHLVEGLGVPHTEIELILVDGVSVGLDRRLRGGERVAVYPMFEALDITPLLRLRQTPLRDPRFFADAQLGRLAHLLRLLGFDTLYDNRIDDAELVRHAAAERRTILSRDRALLMRRAVSHGCHVRDDDPRHQLVYVVRRCDLVDQARPFTRCMECNGLLEAVDKTEILAQLEPVTRDVYDRFWRCTGCGRIYWEGSHYRRLQSLVERVLAEAS